ncbi:universal stress protein [Streptomyces roseirectus]|uniref:Universal stress protein n=1 Tax=Streptomyces roseirectus TaxID=2768066 RepID=A0A7H0I683_9ACTN|nr:universal stress protein [Streptomyces roseirectus]QNP68299.1 universal stress protein [Streptomyces roseirectus]
MSRPVTVGLDGSSESLAAAEWGAGEAPACGAPLRLVHVGDQPPYGFVPFAGEAIPAPGADRREPMLREVAARLAHGRPGLRVGTGQVPGRPVPVLVGEADAAEVLVLGSRGLGRAAGFLLGSVASGVAARSRRPVVLVRSGQPGRAGEVVVGIDLSGVDDGVLGFAFAAAARRGEGLRVVHGRRRASGPDGPEHALAPWRTKFPGVEVACEPVVGEAGSHLVDMSGGACLVVVGRRGEGALGPVAHAVLRHAAAPVAVVPHG